jgi:hypothetical protein
MVFPSCWWPDHSTGCNAEQHLPHPLRLWPSTLLDRSGTPRASPTLQLEPPLTTEAPEAEDTFPQIVAIYL